MLVLYHNVVGIVPKEVRGLFGVIPGKLLGMRATRESYVLSKDLPRPLKEVRCWLVGTLQDLGCCPNSIVGCPNILYRMEQCRFAKVGRVSKRVVFVVDGITSSVNILCITFHPWFIRSAEHLNGKGLEVDYSNYLDTCTPFDDGDVKVDSRLYLEDVEVGQNLNQTRWENVFSVKA